MSDLERLAKAQAMQANQLAAVREKYEEKIDTLKDIQRQYEWKLNNAPKTKTENRNVADNNIPVVYGYTRTPGDLLFQTAGNTENEIYVGYLLSEGQLQALNGIFIDGYQIDLREVTTQVQSNTIYSIPSNSNNQYNWPFAGGLSWEWVNNGSSNLLAQVGGIEVPNLPDVSYVVCKFTKVTEPSIYSRGIPTVEFNVVGKKIPPIGNSEGTIAYSNNPARVIYDYITNNTYGKGIADSDIDATSFNDAASYFDELKELVIFEGTQKQFTFDGVVDTSEKFTDNLKRMLSTFQCQLPYVNDKFKLIVEKPIDDVVADIVYEFNDDNIVGDIKVQYPGTREKANKLLVTVTDRNNNNILTSYELPTSGDTYATYLQQDGVRNLQKSIKFDYIASAHMGLNLGQIMLQRLRGTKNISWTAFADSYKVCVGDLVKITNSINDLDNTVVRVTKVTFNVSSMTVAFEGFLHDDAFYEYDLQRRKIVYPKPVTPTNPGLILPTQPPPVYVPPEDGTLPEPGEPGGPPINPPVQDNPLKEFVYTFAGYSTMDDNERWHLGEFNPSIGLDTGNFDINGARVQLWDPVSRNDRIDNALNFLLTTGISIFDRSYELGMPVKDLYFVIEYLPGRYGWIEPSTIGSGFYEFRFDPEVDVNVKETNNFGDTESYPPSFSYRMMNTKFTFDGRGNYVYQNKPDFSNEGYSPVILLPEGTVTNTFASYQMASPVQEEGDLNIKVYEMVYGQSRYVGKFTIGFNLTNITQPADLVVRNQGLYEGVTGQTPPF